MNQAWDELDLATLVESVDLECKAAQGRDGRGELLISQGAGRGMVYFLPWQDLRTPSVFEGDGLSVLSSELNSKPPELGGKPPELSIKPPELGTKPPELNSKPLYVDWESIPADLQTQLLEIATPVAEKGKVNAALLRHTILALCAHCYLGVRVLAHVLQRDPDDLRKRTLTPLVKEQRLCTAFPANSDPRQAYITNPLTEKE